MKTININYSELPIFNKEVKTIIRNQKRNEWVIDFNKQKETYKCADCNKVLISPEILNLGFFYVGNLKQACSKCGSEEKSNKHICSDCYLKKLEADDPIIKKHFFKYHYYEKKR